MLQEYLTEKSGKSEPQEENDWPLHLDAAESMLPLFYAPGHHNYDRDGLYYLKSMQSLPENVGYHFLRGGYVRCIQGTFREHVKAKYFLTNFRWKSCFCVKSV